MAISKAERLAELRALRASGKSRLSTYEVQEAEAVYDEVDDDGYKKVVRSRLDQDDFVVNDNGEGYADDGREEWNERRPQYDSESGEEAPARGKAAKRKRDEDAEKEARTNASINKYFNAANQKPLVKPKTIATAEDHDFMTNMLTEMDANAANYRAPAVAIKSEARRKTRVISTPLPASRSNGDRTRGARDANNSSPMPHTAFREDDNFSHGLGQDDDMPMSDNVVPSSPVTRAVERKTQVKVKKEEEEEDEDDDLMEVVEAVGDSTANVGSVNINGARPVPKVKEPVPYPTPQSSSPTLSPQVTDAIDASSWNNIVSKLNVMSSSATEAPTLDKLEAEDALEEDGSLHFFWIDYLDLNGSLMLFGKVKHKKNGSFVSAFVKVDNILRKLYFLPREHRQRQGRQTDEEVDMGAVYDEVDTIMSKLKVGVHKIKESSRKYAFELSHVPREANYLKLLYPYDKPALSMDMEGETFSHVFGTNTSLFEQFVLWKNIMGPCWVKIEGADFSAVKNSSWCKLEVQVTKPAGINTLGDSDNLEAPPLTLMSIALRTTMNVQDNKQEILVATARIYENVSLSDTTPAEKLPCKMLTVMRPVSDTGYPTGFKSDAEKHTGKIVLDRTEAGLLSVFMAQLKQIDPDVLMGHKLEEDYSLLLSRLRERKTPGWHRIGRLRRSEWPKNIGRGGHSFYVERQMVAGRLLCDLANDQGKSLMTKCQSWSLAEMCELVLGKGISRREIDNEVALKKWATTRQGLMDYVNHAELDTHFIAAIALKVQMLPLTKVLTNLAGNSWARTLTGTRAERNEYILLHEFYRNKYICPDKVYGKSKAEPVEAADGEEAGETKKKDKYKGGLVFEPEKGLYDRVVLVMDFNSLYPSIIQEYNICFTTVERGHLTEDEETVPEVPKEQSQGVLPRLIATLVNRRREVKKLMKDKTATGDQLATWDIKQLALKLTANSMYGCLGYTKSRFYARPLAILTTFKGREILKSTKDLAEERQLRVIYGDTDSVMINTNVDSIQEAFKVGNEFKRAVNERYRLLEIDIDNIFRRVLLHAKKKYAAINVVEVDGKMVEKLEVKGLDMKRREYCALSKETSSKLLSLLLSGEDPETVVEKIHDHLKELAVRMREFKVPVQKYTIFTQLSKNPQDYPNAKSMPSVQVALRLQARGKAVRAKDVMSFIITGTNNGSQEQASANAYPPDDVSKDKSGLQPDIDYYLHKQILPPVERLCQPISFTNITRLAECLGLDTSKYRVSTASGQKDPQEDLIQPLDSQVPDAVRFASCAPVKLRCLKCRHTFTYRALDEDAGLVSHEGLTCPHEGCGQVLRNLTVVAQLEHQIRQSLAQYYEGWLLCDDPLCGTRTRQMSVYGSRCLGPHGLGEGCLGKMSWEYGQRALYNQLMYWDRAFDVAKAKQRLAKGGAVKTEAGVSEKVDILAEVNRQRFETCRGVIKEYLDRSGRQWVEMGSLFKFAAA